MTRYRPTDHVNHITYEYCAVCTKEIAYNFKRVGDGEGTRLYGAYLCKTEKCVTDYEKVIQHHWFARHSDGKEADYDNLTVLLLKAHLRVLRFPVTGRKAELVKRLKEKTQALRTNGYSGLTYKWHR